MARSPIIQITLTPTLLKKIEAYREKISAPFLADAGRDLIEFALLIKEKSEDDDSRTNRELMEEILLKQYRNEQLNKQVFMHSWDEDKVFNSTKIEMVKEKITNSNNFAQVDFDTFMNKLDK